MLTRRISQDMRVYVRLSMAIDPSLAPLQLQAAVVKHIIAKQYKRQSDAKRVRWYTCSRMLKVAAPDALIRAQNAEKTASKAAAASSPSTPAPVTNEQKARPPVEGKLHPKTCKVQNCQSEFGIGKRTAARLTMRSCK